MTLPNASTRLSSQAGIAPVSTDLCALWAPCVTNADGVPRLYSSLSAALDAHDYCEGLEYGALHLAEAGKPFLLVPVPIATAGAVVRSESMHTGTSKVTAAVGSSGALAEVDGILKVTNGGTIGTDRILLSLSLDGGTSYKPVRLGTATSYVVPNVGVTVSFGAGTLVAGDTILKVKTSGPQFDASGVTLGAAGLVAQQKVVRSWIFVGDVLTRALGQAIETAVNAYESEDERYCVAKFQVRDRRVLESSKLRVAMVGTPILTFAEVGGTGDTLTRDTGSWVTDGFVVGDWVTISGSASNNGGGKVTGVTATVLTFDTFDLAAETLNTASAGGRVTGEHSFVIASGGKTITRNAGSWIAEGFVVGDTVTIDGTASNDGTATITDLTATVLTASGATFVNETIGSCSASVTLTESKSAHVAAMDTMFAPISTSERVDIGHGRLTKLSPITGYTMRRPVQWADHIRSYVRDLSKTTWEKDYGSLEGWGIEGEHDERVDGGAIDARFTCARTWGNGPEGTFIALSITRAADGSVLSMTHNMYVASLVQTVVQRRTEGFVGATLTLDTTTGYATRDSLAKLAAKVNGDLKRNSKSVTPGDIPRWTSAKWTPATDDVLNVPGARMNGTCVLNVNGTIFSVATSVEVS